jgi:hypothetical protein
MASAEKSKKKEHWKKIALAAAVGAVALAAW